MNLPPSPPPEDQSPDGEKLREHSFDGIQEFDRRLPNWWLTILYTVIVFSVIYWFVHMIARVVPTDQAQVDAALAKVAAAKLASAFDVTDDQKFWEMSKNAVFVEAGKATFNSLCAPCHAVALTGAVGPNLVDRAWLHGGTPKDLFKVVNEGVLAKGMPAWGPVLGTKKTAEVVAYVLSYHQAGEPIEVQTSFTPMAPTAPGS
jgi:cytochrome c oxidase cbb3-type subunit III